MVRAIEVAIGPVADLRDRVVVVHFREIDGERAGCSHAIVGSEAMAAR